MRAALLAAFAAAVVTAVPANAASRPAVVSDPKGDWAVPGQDLLGARIYPVTDNGVRSLRADVALADVPVPGSTYNVLLAGEGCESWTLVVSLYATPEESASLQHFPCALTGLPTSDAAVTGTFTVTGRTLHITVPYGAGLRRGSHLTHAGASAATAFVALGAGPPVGKEVITGDLAGNGIDFVLP
jgi:hypothetical protein